MAGNRIIDQTNQEEIDGSESIMGTTQTAVEDTIPGNIRVVLNTLKAWILSKFTETDGLLTYSGTVIKGFKITKITADGAGIWEYITTPTELVLFVRISDWRSMSIENDSSESIMDESSEPIANISYYRTVPTSLYITVSGACTLTIISIPNL
jgi:hypothetical protein